MRRRFLIPFFILLIAGAVSTTRAQGGKAEPKRIEFARGTSSSTIKDSIRRSEEAEYVFSAQQGQKITIALTSVAPKAALFRLRNGEDVLSSWGFDGTNWSGIAPANGDYLMTVVAARGASQRRITYTLRLAIK